MYACICVHIYVYMHACMYLVRVDLAEGLINAATDGLVIDGERADDALQVHDQWRVCVCERVSE
jgi:glutaredoxin 2